MTDFTKPTVADMVIGGSDHNIGTSGTLHDIDWGSEDGYWHENHAKQPWATADRPYDYYRPAYKYGHEASVAHGRKPWDTELEAHLQQGWHTARADSAAEWHHVRDAVHAGYTHHFK